MICAMALFDVVAELTARVRPDVQVVDVGQSATFLCVVSGSPSPSVVWYKDGAPVSVDDDTRLTLSDDQRRLSVRRVFRHDTGVYQCLVENADEGRQSSGRLIIGGIALTVFHTPDPVHCGDARPRTAPYLSTPNLVHMIVIGSR